MGSTGGDDILSADDIGLIEPRPGATDACNGRDIEKRADSCTCIADKAGTELSRFLRLILTATLEGSYNKIVGVTKGLMASGVPEDKARAMEKEADGRFDALMQACGLTK